MSPTVLARGLWGAVGSVLCLLGGGCGFTGSSEPAAEVDAGPDAAPVVDEDRDKDGIKNDDDNCPDVMNPKVLTLMPGGEMMMIQRNHDGDSKGDACDLCPHLATTDDSDVDGDLIGKACDPNSAVANPPAIFYGFYDVPTNQEWKVPAGAGNFADWSVVANVAPGMVGWRQGNATLGWYQVHSSTTMLSRPHVDAAMWIDGFAGPGGNDLRSAGIVFSYKLNNTNNVHNYLLCGLRRDVTSAALNAGNTVLTSAYNDESFRSGESTTQPWSETASGRAVRLVGNVELGVASNSTLNCQATSGAKNQSSAVDSALTTSGYVGLRTFGATAVFDYLFVVDNVAK